MSTYSDTFRELRSPRRVAHTPRSALAPACGARLAAGVMLPLTLGVSLGQPQYGVYAALGALPSGFASMLGQGRRRGGAVALAAVGMGLGAFVGALAATNPPLLVLVAAVFAYAAGIVGAFSDRIAVAALQWPGALLIATSTPDGPRQAAIRGGLVLAGGLGQAALVALAGRVELAPAGSFFKSGFFTGGLVDGRAADAVSPDRPARRSARSLARHLVGTVRAHLGLSTEHGQHALRLAVTAAAAQSAALLLGLPHPYWAALTAILVLKTDHVLTVRRSLDRIGGTAFGVLFGLLLAALAQLGTVPLLLGAGLVIALAYTVFTANYFLFSVFLTGFVVLLLDLLGDSAHSTVGPRLLATLLGGVIALIASHVRPAAA
jgi:MFS family permease